MKLKVEYFFLVSCLQSSKECSCASIKMAKLGFFDILKVFACTIRKGRLCFDWYLKASKAGNDRVTSLQQINKKLLETIGTKKAAGTHFARSQV